MYRYCIRIATIFLKGDFCGVSMLLRRRDTAAASSTRCVGREATAKMGASPAFGAEALPIWMTVNRGDIAALEGSVKPELV